MKALLKYEFRKTWMVKAIILGITAVAQLVYLYGLYIDKGEDVTGTGIFLLATAALASIVIIGVHSVVVLHHDMNTKQGYMLFMTPNSCWKMLGAKVLENGLSIMLAGAFFFGLAALDITLLFQRYGTLQDLIDAVQRLLKQMGEQIDLSVANLGGLTIRMLSSWLCTVCTGFLAVAVASALLNGKRFSGVVSFLLFLVLSWFTGWVERLPVIIKQSWQMSEVLTRSLITAGISLALAALMYAVTAWFMDRYLSV